MARRRFYKDRWRRWRQQPTQKVAHFLYDTETLMQKELNIFQPKRRQYCVAYCAPERANDIRVWKANS